MAHPKDNEKGIGDKGDGQKKTELEDVDLPDGYQNEESQTSGMCECEQRICRVFESFCSHTSLHGIKYIGEKGNIAVRLLWAVVVVLAIGAANYHILQVYGKWVETPVTITISPRVKDIKEVFFPAVTICPPALLTEDFKKEFLNESLNQEQLEQRKNLVKEYCKNGAVSSNYPIDEKAKTIWKKNTQQLSCDVLMVESSYPDEKGTPLSLIPYYVTTSRAILPYYMPHCCTFNAVNKKLMYKNLREEKARDIEDSDNGEGTNLQELLTPTGIGTVNAFTFRMQNLLCLNENLKFSISIHHPAEAPNVEGDGLTFRPGSEVSFTVKPQETESSENLKYLKPEERECKYNEDVHLRFFRNYTEWNCNLDCLANLTLKKCGCLPQYLPDVNGDMELCKTNKERNCFFVLHRELHDHGYNICRCEQACDDVTYLVTPQYIPAESETKGVVKFDVFFTEPTYISYKRSELFGHSDFLASCGGLLGLFMGFSFISMVEVFYFGTYGMWKTVHVTFRKRNEKINSDILE